jgi:hypothetical protein
MENKHDLHSKHEQNNITYTWNVLLTKEKRGRVIAKQLVTPYTIYVLLSKPHILKGATLHRDAPYNGFI